MANSIDATPITPAAEQQKPDSDRQYTAEELLELSAHANQRFALKKGKLIVMSPAGSEHGIYSIRIGARLQWYVEENPGGFAFAAESGFKLESNPDTVLAPDASFVAKERMPATRPKAYFPGPPDLAVEVVSPDDSMPDVQDKVQTWLRYGTQLVWVVEPKTRTVTIYRPDGSAAVLQATDTLDGEDVLPGFRYELSRLFAD